MRLSATVIWFCPAFFPMNRSRRWRQRCVAPAANAQWDIVIDDLVTGERTFYGLAANRERGWFKLNDLYLVVEEEVRALALEARLSELLRALLHGQNPALCNTLTLMKGSN